MKFTERFNKVVGRLSYGLAAIGALALISIMAITVIDVTGRSIGPRGIQGNIDLIGIALVLVFFSGYAYGEIKQQHIQVDVFIRIFPPIVQRIIITSGYFLTLAIIFLFGWQLLIHTIFLAERNVTTAVFKIPLWPLPLATALLIAVFALSILVTIFRHLGELLNKRGLRSYLWLLPGTIIVLLLTTFSLWPSLIPFQMTPQWWGGLIILLLFVLMFLGVHIGAALAVASLLGLSYLSSVSGSLVNLSHTAIGIAREYTWSTLPLFMWMGVLVYRSGMAKDLYDAAYQWIGHIHGGLASATTLACTGLAAVVGDPMIGTLTMGKISLPQMRAYKYDDKLSTATICAASTIGSLIPPSFTFIVYGMITEVSIGKLFMAGIVPGLIFSVLMIAIITIRSKINPKLGPPGDWTPWKEKFTGIKNVWSVILLIVVVLGGIYSGIFTPTEAGAIGAFGALTIGVIRRRFGLKSIASSAVEAVLMVGILLFLFVFAIAFSHFIAASQLAYSLADYIIGLNLSAYAVLGAILLIYTILGCVMNILPAVILTLPIFFPIVVAVGFDPIWFGVIIVVMVNLGTLTPPIGMNVFAMHTIAEDVPIYDIFRGVVPYWIAFFILTVILVAFPEITLFLPSLM